MTDFRYDNVARTFDEELEQDLLQLKQESEKKAAQEPEHTSGIQRIAKGQTPLDEVQAIIDASRHDVGHEIAKHRVRRKLAAIREESATQVDNFINAAKNGG